MPYPGGRDQVLAIYYSIRRKKGEAAAKRWLARHRGELRRRRGRS